MNDNSAAAEDLSHHTDTARLEAFSDGVFAIAITLLVLEISVPHGSGSELARDLAREWPSYLGYALSFVVIGIMWMNHHTMFKDIERVDHGILVFNLLLLMSIAFLPFPTAVLAEHLKDADARLTATVFYGGTQTVIAVFFNALWLYAVVNRGLIDHHVSDTRLQSRTRRYLAGPLTYGATVLVAFVSPWISLAIWIGLGVFYLLPLSE
jgi:uncharacterized membrane protein